MPKYLLPGAQAAVSTSYKTAAIVVAAASAPRRGRVQEIIVGQSSNPNATDTYVQFDLSRQTVAGTASAFIPNPMDPADAPCSAVGSINASAEGTITGNSSLFSESINQRGAFRWSEQNEAWMPIWPAVAASGVALRALSPTYAGAVIGTLGFLE